MSRNPVLYKSLVIGVIVLFIGVGIQPSIAYGNKSSDLSINPITENVLPDLIIQDISYVSFENGWDSYLVDVEILNQGDAYAYGDVTFEFSIIRTIFWYFNLKVCHYNTFTISLDNGLAPGEKITSSVGLGWISLASFGSYKFYAGINFDEKLHESNYDNNERMERVITIFGWWVSI